MDWTRGSDDWNAEVHQLALDEDYELEHEMCHWQDRDPDCEICKDKEEADRLDREQDEGEY